MMYRVAHWEAAQYSGPLQEKHVKEIFVSGSFFLWREEMDSINPKYC